MPIFTELPPLSLYIHLPWCVRKCPYCDFNSHEMKNDIPQEIYKHALLDELTSHLQRIANRTLKSIFFGGGTPSLFSGKTINEILRGVNQFFVLDECEITLEANPGTVDQANFDEYFAAGVNRLSLGVQSFQNEKLNTLGRIHDNGQAMNAISAARNAGFTNINIDIMYGLPEQSLEDAIADINDALSLSPTHFSWYQLTLEPNTLFYVKPPVLPNEDRIYEIQETGQALLKNKGYLQYEVSAYSLSNYQCKHNQNYWEFGDYLGIGAGAHSKITDLTTQSVVRFAQVKHPKDYLDREKRNAFSIRTLSQSELVFEFMLNALRLTSPIDKQLFETRTGLKVNDISSYLAEAQSKGLLEVSDTQFITTLKGKRFLNNLIMLFMDDAF